MAKFRKKPVVIDAFQYGVDVQPDWFINHDRFTGESNQENGNRKAKIETLEGIMLANRLDYIIKGVNGEIYPCKPDIFDKTYEKVNE